MSFLFSQLGFYLLVRTAAGVGLVFAGVAATILLLDLVEQLRDIGTRAPITLIDALGLTLLRLPQLIEQTLPVVTLAGTMLALFGLNRRSELVAIRAAGVSAWRFLAPTALVAVLIGLFATTILNPLGATLYERYEATAQRLSGGPVGPDTGRIWLRQGDAAGQVVITAAGVDPSKSLLREAVFLFFDIDASGALSFNRRLAAREAELRDGFWQMTDVIEATPGGFPLAQPFLALPTPIEPDALIDRFVSPTTLSFWALPQFIAEARAAGLAPTRYELRRQTLLALPALLAAMAALGAVFSLRLQRLGGLARWGLMGLGAGSALFFIGEFAAAFATAGILSPAIAAWAPPIGGFFSAMAVLAHLEDG